MLENILVFIPVLTMILYTVKSHRVIEPIIISALIAYFIKYKFGFIIPFIDGIYDVIRGEAFSFIIVMLLSFGAVIHIIKKSNGILALKRFVSDKVKTGKTSLLMTWILGLLLFMDDYLNSLIVGTTMRNITDRFKISREKISIIALSTGVPICILAPISTWAVFLFGVLTLNGFVTADGLVANHIKIIPLTIYPVISIIGSLLLVVGIVPDVMYLKKASIRSSKGQLIPLENTIREEVKDSNDGNIMNFFIPIVVLVLVAAVSGDVVMGALSSLAVTLIWLKFSKQMSISDFVDHAVDGMAELIHPLVFMLFAFVFGHILNELGFADTVISLLSSFLMKEMIPVIAFIITSIIVFGGVDVWAVMPLVIPVFVPLAQNFDINMYLTIGAVLSGISFGTQMCFISESHILVSETLDLKPIQQVTALAPYAIVYSIITSIVYVLLGFIL